jgi:hypothetical protein
VEPSTRPENPLHGSKAPLVRRDGQPMQHRAAHDQVH